jgi:hypothetical protein
MPPERPGYSIEIHPESLEEFEFSENFQEHLPTRYFGEEGPEKWSLSQEIVRKYARPSGALCPAFFLLFFTT